MVTRRSGFGTGKTFSESLSTNQSPLVLSIIPEENEEDAVRPDSQKLLPAATTNQPAPLVPGHLEQLVATMHLNVRELQRLWALSLVQLCPLVAIDFLTPERAHTISYLLYVFFTLALIAISMLRLFIYCYKANKRLRQLPLAGLSYQRQRRSMAITAVGLTLLTVILVGLWCFFMPQKVSFDQLLAEATWPVMPTNFPSLVDALGQFYCHYSLMFILPPYIVILGVHALLAFRNHARPLPGQFKSAAAGCLGGLLLLQLIGAGVWGYLAWMYYQPSELVNSLSWFQLIERPMMANLLATLAATIYLGYIWTISQDNAKSPAPQEPILWWSTWRFIITAILAALTVLAAAYFLNTSQTVFGIIVRLAAANNSAAPPGTPTSSAAELADSAISH